MKMICRDEMLITYVKELEKSFEYVEYVFNYDIRQWIIVVR